MSAISATATIPAPRQELFARLARLENHWALADRWVEVVSVNGEGDGGEVRLNGPMGLSRTAHTTVDRLEEPSRIEGTARIGDRTTGRVSWTLSPEPDGTGTEVTLRAELLDASPPDRTIWNLGGRLWLESRLRVTLERLAEEYSG